jgi:hypothetical protein
VLHTDGGQSFVIIEISQRGYSSTLPAGAFNPRVVRSERAALAAKAMHPNMIAAGSGHHCFDSVVVDRPR